MGIKFLFSIITFVFFLNIGFSQSFIFYGDKTYGGFNFDKGLYAIKTDSIHLLLAGVSKNNINGDKTGPLCDSISGIDVDNWVIKIDTAFNILWDKSIGGNKGEKEPHIILSNDLSRIMLSATSNSDSTCEKTENNRGNNQNDYWIYAFDLNGNKIMDKTFGGSGNEGSVQIIELQSGAYVVCGVSSSPISADKTVAPYGTVGEDYWAVKFDSTGNKLWDKVYGGTNLEMGGLAVAYQYNFQLLADKGDDFIIAGTTKSPVSGDISDTSRGGEDVWIIKIDSLGNKIWDKRYGGTLTDRSEHIIKCQDNGYLLCGSTSSPQGGDISDPLKSIGGDCWIVKLDSLGNKIWDKRYGGALSAYGTWIESAPGGGYWVSGFVQGDTGIDVTEPQYGLQGDYWIFKIDSAGNKLWDKRFGGPNFNYGSAFVIMPDSSIFLYGWANPGINAVKTDSGKGGQDYWLVHFKYTDNTVGTNSIAIGNNQISISPNPTNGILNLKSSYSGNAVISVYNLIGEEVYEQKNILQKLNVFNFSQLKNGMYFLKVANDKFLNTIKFVKQ